MHIKTLVRTIPHHPKRGVMFLAAAVRLIEGAGGEVVECGFVIELPELGGRRRIEALGHGLFALREFDGE
jgi:hypothetical protein